MAKTHPPEFKDVAVIGRGQLAAAVAKVARWCGDLDMAEEAVQDALVKAVRVWRSNRQPDNPDAWIVTTAKRSALDKLRGLEVRRRSRPDIRMAEVSRLELADQKPETDERLGMLLACCDERLPPETQTVLALRYVAGLTVAQMARAFICGEAALEQRLTRAKKTAREIGVRFDAPDVAEIANRLPAIHLTLYLIFNEGYAATQGAELLGNEACAEALYLAELLLGFVPNSTETLGLVALMKLQASRAEARVGSDGALVRLHEQDRSLWNAQYVDDAFRLLAVARSTGRAPGQYELQAAIALHHAHASSVAAVDWPAVVALYDCLVALRPDPVIRLNRAVAVAMANGPVTALALVEDLRAKAPHYALIEAVRGDMLLRLGRNGEAIEAFESAQRLTQNLVERSFLYARLSECRARRLPG